MFLSITYKGMVSFILKAAFVNILYLLILYSLDWLTEKVKAYYKKEKISCAGQPPFRRGKQLSIFYHYLFYSLLSTSIILFSVTM